MQQNFTREIKVLVQEQEKPHKNLRLFFRNSEVKFLSIRKPTTMHNIETIYFFIFVFTILVTLRNVAKFISTLLQREPKPLVYNSRELITLGLSISYIITYIYFT